MFCVFRRMFVSTLCIALLSTGASWGQDQSANKTSPLLEKVKQLEGEWVAVDPKDGEEDKVVLKYEVTSTGLAVLETYDPDLPTEEVTLYYGDGDSLMLTHYCALGNQARMAAQPESNEGQVAFACVGPSNVKSEDEGHMHKMDMTISDKDHIKVKWTMYQNGKEIQNYPFDLKRKTN